MKRKRAQKTGEKQLEQELKRENKMYKQMISYPDMNIALGNSINAFTRAQKYALFKGIEKHLKDGIDYDYLKCIIFPELFSGDIPQPFTNLSYCRFSDRSNVTINTGMTGTANLIFYPRVNVGPALFYKQGSLPFSANLNCSTTEAAAAPVPAYTNQQCGFVQNYSAYFTQCNLISASITVQYIGQLEQESGIMVGSHIYGVDPQALTTDDIENGQYVTRARPSEGLRFVYLPMEVTDYDLYTCQDTISHNAGSAPTGNEKTFTFPLNFASTKTYFMDGTLTGTLVPPSTAASSFTLANNYPLLYSTNTNYIAMYWTGLQQQNSWLRADIMRRFIGIPKSQYRDIVEMVRNKENFDAKKTFDILRQMCLNSPVGGHTMREMDKNQEALTSGIMNANEAIHLGHLTGVETLSDLAGSLQLSNAESKGLVENYGQVGRIYPYSI